jgi:hypothetical protein
MTERLVRAEDVNNTTAKIIQRQETARAKEERRAIIRAEEDRLAWALARVQYERQARARAQEQLQAATKKRRVVQTRANKEKVVKAVSKGSAAMTEELVSSAIPTRNAQYAASRFVLKSDRKEGGGAATGSHQRAATGRDTRQGAHASGRGGPGSTPLPQHAAFRGGQAGRPTSCTAKQAPAKEEEVVVAAAAAAAVSVVEGWGMLQHRHKRHEWSTMGKARKGR